MQEEQHPQVRQLRKQMVTLLAQTRENEEKTQRYRTQEEHFLSCDSISAVVKCVIDEYKQTFSLDAVTLVLDDPDYEIQRALEDDGMDPSNQSGLVFLATPYQLRDAARLIKAPTLGAFTPKQHDWLFSRGEVALKSVAELPLSRGDRVIGSLNLASRLADRFPPQAKPGLLVSMANVLAVCVENALNKYRLERVGLTDPLTGIANRKYLDRRLEEEAARSRRSSEPLACLMVEPDDFDGLSERYGRRAADHVLVNLADVIGAQLRGSDTVARFDGSVFSVLLVRTSASEAEYVSERIREVIRDRSFAFEGEPIEITISIGIAALRIAHNKVIPRNIAERVVEEASRAMRDASQREGDQVVTALLG